MMQGNWKSLVNWFQNLFGIGNSQKPTALLPHNEPPPALEDADYEYLFMQLIEGVAHGWQQQRILKFFDALQHRTTQEQWLAWLRRFGDRLLASSVPNNELAARMVQIGEIGCGEIGVMAYDIGMLLLTRQDPTDQTWDLDSPQVVYVDAEEMTFDQDLDTWNDSNPESVSPQIPSQQTSVQLDSPQVIYVDAEKTTDVEPNLNPWNDSNPELVSTEIPSQQTSVQLDSPQVIYVDAEKTTDVEPNLNPWNDSNPDLVSPETEESQEFSIDELLFMLEQNPALAQEMSEQLQVNSTNPEAILEAFIQQLDKDMQIQADEAPN